MENKMQNYQDILGEALNAPKQIGQYGNVKALVALAMVVGDLNESVKTINNNINKLNENINKYSISSDKHANWMKWLTAGLIIVGIAQIITVIVSSS